MFFSCLNNVIRKWETIMTMYSCLICYSSFFSLSLALFRLLFLSDIIIIVLLNENDRLSFIIYLSLITSICDLRAFFLRTTNLTIVSFSWQWWLVTCSDRYINGILFSYRRPWNEETAVSVLKDFFLFFCKEQDPISNNNEVWNFQIALYHLYQ